MPCGGPWGVLHISGTVHLTPRTSPPFNRFMILTSAPRPDVNVNKQLQILYMWDSLSLSLSETHSKSGSGKLRSKFAEHIYTNYERI